MATKEDQLKADIERAVLDSFVATNKVKWTPIVTPQLQRFAENVRDAVVEYATTPITLESEILLGDNGEKTLVHGLGYIPKVNPIEKETTLVGGLTKFVVDDGDFAFVEITTNSIVISGPVNQKFRVRIW